MSNTTVTYFLLLMWKNFVIKRRHRIAFILDILIPVLLASILLLDRLKNFSFPVRKATIFNSVSAHELNQYSGNPIELWEIDFAPKHQRLEELMRQAIGRIESSQNLEIRGFDTAEELQRFMLVNGSLAGIVFNVRSKQLNVGWPKNFKFTIRFPARIQIISENWLTQRKFPDEFGQGPRNPKHDDGGRPPGYVLEGFAALQSAISEAYIELATGNGSSNKKAQGIPKVELQRFPYKPYFNDYTITLLKWIGPLIMVMSFIQPCGEAVRYITTEKEKQLKEAMKIMGLSTALHWSAWFFTLWLCLLIAVVLITIVLKVPWFPWTIAALPHTSASLLLVFLMIYTASLITFSFMLSTFFSKPNIAGGFSGLFHFIFFIPYLFAMNSFATMPLPIKLLYSLFFNTAMAFGFRIFTSWENLENGSNWSNLFKTITIEENLSLGLVMVMMVVDGILYMVIALYVEKIMPGETGTAHKWYFPCMRSFWCPGKTNAIDQDETYVRDPERFEPEDPNGIIGIQLVNLTKQFGGKTVVDRLSMNMYENQIMVLLGHNGAGKTTTISMITGFISPTSGNAIVNGFSILDNLPKVRKSFGFCPQHDILFDELTVEEHIIFYSRLKGLPKAEIPTEIDRYLNILELQDKRNAQSKTLSGGMKRKLSVGLAFCGRSKIVLCDEPSSGMDPTARRSLWDLLLLEKNGRTILLTTHFMDEADILGDRIAIMSQGTLQCCGTPFFLKKKFGSGYRLICSKKPDCDVTKVTALILKHIPEAKLRSNVGSELSYDLPEKSVDKFERMLSDLERSQDMLLLNGYGISMTTLEDVFLSTGTEFSEEQNRDDIKIDNASATEKSYQWRAMFLKRFYHFKRNWFLVLLQIFIPLLMIFFTLRPSQKTALKDLPPLVIDLKIYGSTVTLLEKVTDNEIAKSFQKMFEKKGKEQQLMIVTTDMNTEIIRLQMEDLITVNTRYAAAATIKDDEIIAWFNNEALHTVPIALNLVHNAIAKALLGSNHSIEVINAPLPFAATLESQSSKNSEGLGLVLVLAMVFVSAIFVLFPIKERVSRSKLLQIVSGGNVLVFWLVHFIWDFMVFIVIACFLVVLLGVYRAPGFETFFELGATFLLILAYGFATLPITYIASFIYDDGPKGLFRLMIFHIITGPVLWIIVRAAQLFGKNSKIADRIKQAAMIFPGYSLGQSLNNQEQLGTTKATCDNLKKELQQPMKVICQSTPDCCNMNLWSWKDPGILLYLVVPIIVGIVLFLLIQLIDMGFFQFLCIGRSPKKSPVDKIDDDVQNEKDRVSKMSTSEIREHNLVTRYLTKYYKCSFLAVNNISIGIGRGECFGLLGANGAGKTSTIKMLTGDAKISYGNIWIRGYSIRSARPTVYKMIGYCPQFDGLLLDLTGAETLRIFCLLRGIDSRTIETELKRLARTLAFEEHLNKKVSQYSGGNRRKLSAVLAVLGNPEVVYLDEPTTGIDPASRRKLWNLICKVRDAGKAIILTSHSMEECEALCTIIAIMVNGEFRCLGSMQHLKNKFSYGFTLTIKLKANSSESEMDSHKNRVMQFANETFNGAVIKYNHRNYLSFEIERNVMPYSQIFGLMEANRQQLHIEDYSLNQATLEQVFLSLTKKQSNDGGNSSSYP